MNIDPLTNLPLPSSAIQRILYIAPKVHIYRIPPPSSPRYLVAANWTVNPADQIFTARLRILETAIPAPPASGPSTPASGGGEKLSVTILLEDANTGELFAAAPYTHPSTVEQASDSSRFFAVRVVGERGMKATLGVGFEERPVAFDFSIALQDVRRTLALVSGSGSGPGMNGGKGGRDGRGGKDGLGDEGRRDLSLKEGEMITIKIGGKGRRGIQRDGDGSLQGGGNNPFAIAPPPASASNHGKGSSVGTSNIAPILAPPPAPSTTTSEAKDGFSDDGFDDGEFGEFQ